MYNPRHCLVLLLFVLFSTGLVFAESEIPIQDKTPVTDGHVFHDIGNLWNHVSNFGLIGSWPSTSTTFSSAPSARWRGENGNDYLWGAGLWVGGVVLGEHLVSTAGPTHLEFLATDAPSDTIYSTMFGAAGGNRFPWSNADDDNDGLEDEDPLNGLDDDGDGLVDEDFAAFGDQQFIARYNDYQISVIENNPVHVPMHIDVVQKSIQWSDPQGLNYIGYDFTITNVGVTDIEQVYVGMNSDFDIGDPSDDLCGSTNTMALTYNGSYVPVQSAYMYSAHEPNGSGVCAGWVLCGHTTDPTGLTAPVSEGVYGFHSITGSSSFENGGDPTNDSERYNLLSRNSFDEDTFPAYMDDYRTLITSGPFPVLCPGESISYKVALVVGVNRLDFLHNAANAWLVHYGSTFDRDGDPANGEEFVVNWLPPEDIPVATSTGHLTAKKIDGGAKLQIETNMDLLDGLAIIRQSGGGFAERSWNVSELTEEGFSGHNRLLGLVDNDPVGWPRQYSLVQKSSGHTILLDNVVLDVARNKKIELSASPNPFNPTVNIQFTMAKAGHALLRIYDIRGQLVRTLMNGPHPGGTDEVSWNGKDEQGNSMASGIYMMRLEAGDMITGQRITLVR